MKNLIFLISTIILFSFSSCSWVEPNHEGVLMTNYGRNGESDFTLVSGKQNTLFPGTELISVPMYEQRADCESIRVYAKDGGEFTVDPTYAYEAIRGKGIKIAFNYKHLNSGKEFFDNIEGSILNTRVLNAYREEARNYSTDSLMNNVGSYESNVQKRLVKEFETSYFKLNEITSNLVPPASLKAVIEERNNQIQQANKLKNEVESEKQKAEILLTQKRAVAEAKKIEADAQAYYNEKTSQTLTQNLINKMWIDKWSGDLPSTMTGSNSTMLIQPK